MESLYREIVSLVLNSALAVVLAVGALLVRSVKTLVEERITAIAVSRITDAAQRQVALARAEALRTDVGAIVDNLTINLPQAVVRAGATQEGLTMTSSPRRIPMVESESGLNATCARSAIQGPTRGWLKTIRRVMYVMRPRPPSRRRARYPPSPRARDPWYRPGRGRSRRPASPARCWSSRRRPPGGFA